MNRNLQAFLGAAILLSSTPIWCQPLSLGIESIIKNEAYVVHSSMDQDGFVFATSNIYVIKGMADSVWIFGMGYGDPSNLPIDTSDIYFYRGPSFEPSEGALFDARKVDTIITQYFGLQPSHVKLNLIAPHFHLDHLNKEFISALLDSLEYPKASSQVLLHINDYLGATCNSKCCEMLPCGNAQYKGAPFHPAWTADILDLFRTLGTSVDPCNQPLTHFQSTVGRWTILKGDTIHTAGALDLDCESKKYRILGSRTDDCLPGYEWKIFKIHGNLPVCKPAIELTQVNAPGLHQAAETIRTVGDLSLIQNSIYLAPCVELNGIFDIQSNITFEIQPIGCQ